MKNRISKSGDTIIRGKVKVEWAELGEGICGDYDPEDKDDIELLRFDVFIKDIKGANGWTDPGDASYCTRMPVSATKEQKIDGLKWIMDEVYGPLTDGYSIKKLCERLSWIDLDSLKANRL